MIKQYINQIKKQEDLRNALSRLRAEIKQEERLSYAKELIGDGDILEPLLRSEDPKIRKNTAALIGDLAIGEAAEALYLAYEREETLFVRGMLLQALLKADPTPYLDRLQKRYEWLCAQEVAERDKKHITEELHALEKILRRADGGASHTFCGWSQKLPTLLTVDAGYGSLTAGKLPAAKTKITSVGVWSVTERLAEVVKIRTFRELLFPIRLDPEVKLADGPQALGESVAASKLLPMIKRCHKEGAPFYFRLEIKGGVSLEERSRYMKRAAAAIEEHSARQLRNAPDGYEFEIRLMVDKEKKLHAFLKMFTIPMERFAYRRETIATSIYPSFAATLLELAKPYLKPRAQVLDPCCGVGTMLVERHKLMPVREAYAIDIFGDAVEKASINTTLADMRVHLIHKDYLEFTHRYPFDEIIANMPQRGKRSREEQDAFYQGFFEQSQQLLASDGIMILYSDEMGFVKKQLRLCPGLHLIKEYLIREKGQFYLFVIGGKDSVTGRG